MTIRSSISLAGAATLLSFAAMLVSGCAETPSYRSLVPSTPSEAPDYLCTWNLQGYVVDYRGSDPTREAMNERSMFADSAYCNWSELYPSIRQDLYFVMDDSWDIPAEANSTHRNPHLGTAELDPSRFPSFKGSPTQRMCRLNDRMKQKGWKGIGGWICAQKADNFADADEAEYWATRLKSAQDAGMEYWKVDWGRNDRNGEWRRMLTDLGREHAPDLWIEHAMVNDYVTFSDVFRTYDVEDIIAQPVTIQRICRLLPYAADEGAQGIINCEDEPYIAAGLGCAIGVMRHQLGTELPDGTQDFVFPPVGRNYKKRLDEVVRGVRWHRIAAPFGVAADCSIDTTLLTDSWEVHEKETYVNRPIGSVVRESAPARVSRGMPLPEVADTSATRPYVLASRYPNGAVAVAAIGRTIGREYVSKAVPVSIEVADAKAPVGIFGYFKELAIDYPVLPQGKFTVLAQDLAGDRPVDITARVTRNGNRLVVPGNVIDSVGLMAATAGDLSEPGMVLVVR